MSEWPPLGQPAIGPTRVPVGYEDVVSGSSDDAYPTLGVCFMPLNCGL